MKQTRLVITILILLYSAFGFTTEIDTLSESVVNPIFIDDTPEKEMKSVQFEITLLDKLELPNYELGYVSVDKQLIHWGLHEYSSQTNFPNRQDLKNLESYNTPKTIRTGPLEIEADEDEDYRFLYKISRYGYILLSEGPIESGHHVIKRNFKRIDVNHIEMTLKDGTSYKKKGSVEIFQVTGVGANDPLVAGEKWQIQKQPTGFGFWVPTGWAYIVEVTINTETGVKKQQEIFDFR